MLNYRKVIQDLFDTSMDIRKDIFSKTVFIDEAIEDLYQLEYSKNSGFQKNISEIMLISGYVASILYIFLAFQRILFLQICIAFLVLNLILFGISMAVKSNKNKYYISILQIFLISLNLHIKINLLCFFYYTPENDNYKEIIRVIIYDFISINLFLLLKLEANIYISLGFNSMNILSCINSEIHSNEEHFYFLDMLIGTFLTLIFFAFRKAWDYRLRVIFSEKYKSNKLVMYTFDFINDLNGFHLNIRDDNKIFIDEKFSNFLNKTLANDENKLNGNVSPLRDAENNLGKPDSNLFHMEDLNVITYFLAKLKPYLFDVDLENEKEMYNNNINNNEESKKIKNSFNNNEQTIKEIESISHCYNLNYNSENINLVFNLNEARNINNANTNKNNSTQKLFAYNMNLSNERQNARVNESELILLDRIKLLKQSKLNPVIKETKSFKHLGIYFFKNSFNTYKYFDVYFRNIEIINSKNVIDLIFYDLTDLIVSKKAILQENTQKQKILAKIAHEFKTPVNSIIGLINNIRESFSSSGFETEKTLDLIENLSNYIIFLVSDIIHYSNPKSIKDLKIKSEDLDMRSLLIFCFDILNSLLKCNSIKHQKIKTHLEIADCIDRISVLSDEFRLKQIVLNLLSNAVKFTSRGNITIKCHKHSSKNLLVIKVIDTGSGIRDADKAKIFEEFCVLENLNKDDKLFNSGLGLSICRLLASKLNLKLKFKSEYGVGTQFKMLIPIASELKEKTGEETAHNNEEGSYNFYNKQSFMESKTEIKGNTITVVKEKDSSDDGLSCIVSDKGESIITRKLNSIKNRKTSQFGSLDFESHENTTIICDYRNINILRERIFLEKHLPEKSGSLTNKSICDSSGSPQKSPIADFKKTFINNKFTLEKNLTRKSLFEMSDNNKKIFVIDDNQIIQNSIKRMIELLLKEKGNLDMIDIHTGADGVDLIKLLFPDNNMIDTQKVLCVFIDENMEYLNGSDAVKIMRHIELKNKLNHVNVVTVSCHEDTKFVEFVCNSGVDLFLSKPVSKNDIANILRRFGII